MDLQAQFTQPIPERRGLKAYFEISLAKQRQRLIRWS